MQANLQDSAALNVHASNQYPELHGYKVDTGSTAAVAAVAAVTAGVGIVDADAVDGVDVAWTADVVAADVGTDDDHLQPPANRALILWDC